MLKIDGGLARNIDFEVANFQVLRKTRRKTSILKLQSAKVEGCLVRNARFGAQDVSHPESLKTHPPGRGNTVALKDGTAPKSSPKTA